MLWQSTLKNWYPTSHSWDDVYVKEVANFEETGDEGEIWWVTLFQKKMFFFSIWHTLLLRRFGEDSVEKMVDWTLENVPTGTTSHPRILEIGSGNGTLLFALHEAGYAASHLSGIDYSPDAVKLARMVAAARSQNGEQLTSFHVCDFISELPPLLPPPAASPTPPSGQHDAEVQGSWDLLLDKGTYDAIALGEKDESGRCPVAVYPARASKLLRENGYFLITCKS
jgi:SAM-dependent methyltransferase